MQNQNREEIQHELVEIFDVKERTRDLCPSQLLVSASH